MPPTAVPSPTAPPSGGRITRAQVDLAALVREAGSVQAFARAMGMQPSTVRILLGGGTPKGSTIGKLAPHGIAPASWFESAEPVGAEPFALSEDREAAGDDSP